MKDPQRIATVVAALQRAWEGQPELQLSQLLGMLANAGIGWGADDEQLLSLLEAMAEIHPADFPPPMTSGGAWELVCTQPEGVILSDAHRIIRRNTPPAAWEYSRIRPTGPQRPLVVADTEGFEHRLGVIKSITRLVPDELSAATLDGLRVEELRGNAFLVRTDSHQVVLARAAEVYEVSRRSVQRRSITWLSIVTCRPAETLVVGLPDGTRCEFGTVRDILRLSAPARELDVLDAF